MLTLADSENRTEKYIRYSIFSITPEQIHLWFNNQVAKELRCLQSFQHYIFAFLKIFEFPTNKHCTVK